VKDHRNVTLSLPEPLLRRFKVHAAERNQSMTALMTEAIRSLIERENSEQQAAAAKRRILARIRNAPDWGTAGRIGWSREDLHER
jgi:metal-responsive CopG/Arc/MetJ family transcriptional regulator